MVDSIANQWPYTGHMSKLPSGKVALIFDNKVQLLRCLDELARYEGLIYEVVPWTTLYVPTSLGKICKRRGLASKVVTVVPDDELDPDEQAQLMESAFQLAKRIAKDAGDIPSDA